MKFVMMKFNEEKNSFKFKSEEQREELKTVLKEMNSLMIVLLMRDDKNLLFILSIMMKEAKTTIVMIPFVALMNEMIERCKDARISCIKWKIELRYRIRVIVMMIEMMSMREFMNYTWSLELEE